MEASVNVFASDAQLKKITGFVMHGDNVATMAIMSLKVYKNFVFDMGMQ